MNNALMVIEPYWNEGAWVFDDPAAGLEKEPFVAGMPEMIEDLVRDIPDARGGFRLLFSALPFPGFQVHLKKSREDGGGVWYCSGANPVEGWLCPALFKYFGAAPESIYVKAEPRPGEVERCLAELKQLRDRVEELEKLTYKLTLEGELLRSGQDPASFEEPSHRGIRYWDPEF